MASNTNVAIGPIMDPELRDVLDAYKLETGYQLNCVQIGTIQSYDPITCTVEVAINFKRKMADGRIIAYPALSQCPVFFLQGGQSYISMPIQSGDTCIILFNDRDMDNWWLSGVTDVPNTPRSHSLSDAIALVGIQSMADVSPLNPNVVKIYGGNKKIAIKNAAATLKTLVDTLVDTIKSLKVIDAGTPTAPAGTWSIDPATTLALTNLKAQFDLLLDEGTP